MLEKMHAKITIEELEPVIDIYELYTAEELTNRVKDVVEYIQEGQKYAAETTDPRFLLTSAHEELMHLDDILDACKGAMVAPVQLEMSIVSVNDEVINLRPWMDWLADNKGRRGMLRIRDVMNDLVDVTVNFLHEGNLWKYKDVSTTIVSLEFLARQMSDFDKK
jgi:hypothetical protein